MHILAFINPSKAYPAAEQLRIIEPFKPRFIFNTKDKETIKEVCRSVRKGTRVLVSDLAILGRTRKEMRAAVEAIEKKGGILLEGKTGKEATADCLAMWARADRTRQRLNMIEGGGSRPKPKSPIDRRLTKSKTNKTYEEVEAIWFDKKIASNAEAAALAGVSVRVLFEWHGPSGRKAGRPKADEVHDGSGCAFCDVGHKPRKLRGRFVHENRHEWTPCTNNANAV